jgi:hypothetical protein
MTSPSSVDIPKPLDWQQLERLTRAVFSESKKADFQRFGREGQRQNGIDIIGCLAEGTVTGIQCKGRTSSLGKRLSQETIDKAIEEAESYGGRLDEFFIVSTSDNDARLQEYVIELSTTRKAAGKFGITLWAWQSMADQIRSCPKTLQTFYGEWWRKPSFVFFASLIVIAVIFGASSLIFSKRAEHWFAWKDESRHTTVKELGSVTVTLEGLEEAYRNCIESMDGKAFIFSGQLQDGCVKPIETPLKRLQQQRDEFAGMMDAQSFNEVLLAKNYLDEDFRQLLIAADAANSFERGAVDFAKSSCPNPKYKTSIQADEVTAFRKSGEYALAAQMARYFEIRDFVLPSITSIKARIAIAMRAESGENIPDELVQEANALNDIVRQERAYTYKPTGAPFTTARVKQMSDRNITSSGTPDPIENLIWQHVATEAVLEGARGNRGDVEYLIACGLFKPSARSSLSEPPQ